eukprot:Transcript_4978.p3 GENE.Transcript_4978~~Transcript_4978.p3  ORF type:complete len:395 (-),score=186.10 Transcript_4978:126-1310(-)
MELIGRASGTTAAGAPVLSYEPLSLDEFRTFCEAVDYRGLVGEAEWNLEGEGGQLEAFIEAGKRRRDMLADVTRERLEAAFKAIDVDDSGFIDMEELTAFGLRVGAGWSQSAVERLMGQMDTDGDSQISFDEFSTFLQQMGLHGCYAEVSKFIEEGAKRRAGAGGLSDEQAAALFAAIDVDGSGSIEMGELAAFGKAIDAGWTREACAALLGRMDTDGDHAISPQEFRSFMAEAGLHGMHDEVTAFITAGLSLRRTDGEGSPSVRRLSDAHATLPVSELPRHAHALRQQIEQKKREALALKRRGSKAEAAALYREVKGLERQASGQALDEEGAPAQSDAAAVALQRQRSADAALRMAEAELLLVDAQAATTEAATLAPAEADDPELNAALAAAT